MKPWPERSKYVTDTPYGDGMTMAQIADYQSARAEAAMERLTKLRKAAIRFMASDIANKHKDYGCVDCIAEALAAIGPIPGEGK